jgi:hypothetical protein
MKCKAKRCTFESGHRGPCSYVLELRQGVTHASNVTHLSPESVTHVIEPEKPSAHARVYRWREKNRELHRERQRAYTRKWREK